MNLVVKSQQLRTVELNYICHTGKTGLIYVYDRHKLVLICDIYI